MFYLDLFHALDRHRVDYLLVGGLATNLHGVPGMTMDVDIVARRPQALARAETRDVGGIPVHLAAIEDLIRLKQAASRRQDLADIESLERLRREP